MEGVGTPGTLLTKRAHVVSVSVLVCSSAGRKKETPPVSAQKVDGPEGALSETSTIRPRAAAMAQTPTPKRRHSRVFWRQPICNLSTMGSGMASNGMSVRMLRLPMIRSMWYPSVHSPVFHRQLPVSDTSLGPGRKGGDVRPGSGSICQ